MTITNICLGKLPFFQCCLNVDFSKSLQELFDCAILHRKQDIYLKNHLQYRIEQSNVTICKINLRLLQFTAGSIVVH